MLRRFTLVTLLLLLTSTVSFAQDRTGKVDIGVNLSAVDPDNGDYDTGFYAGGTLAYGLSEWLALGIEAGHAEIEPDFGSTSSITGGDISAIPLLADIILRLRTNESLDLYGVVGLGVLFVDSDDISGTVSGVPFNIDVDADNAFAVKVGGGADWFLNEHWILNFEVSYVFAETDIDTTTNVAGLSLPIQLNDVELDYLQIGGGIKYVF